MQLAEVDNIVELDTFIAEDDLNYDGMQRLVECPDHASDKGLKAGRHLGHCIRE
jgi:hypothetical protein